MMRDESSDESSFTLSDHRLQTLHAMSTVLRRSDALVESTKSIVVALEQVNEKLRYTKYLSHVDMAGADLDAICKRLKVKSFSGLRNLEKSQLIEICSNHRLISNSSWILIKRGFLAEFGIEISWLGKIRRKQLFVSGKRQQRMFERLLFSYVSNFDAGARRIQDIGETLEAVLPCFETINSPWNNCIRDPHLSFFKPEGLAGRLRTKCRSKILESGSITNVLKELGLLDLRLNLSSQCTVKLCESFLNDKEIKPILQEYLSSALFGRDVGEIRYMLVCLLFPIMDAIKNSTDTDRVWQDRVKKQLLSWFGDPRLADVGYKNWPYLEDDPHEIKMRECHKIFRRWLTHETLNLFFDAIEQTYREREQTVGEGAVPLRHFSERRRLWLQYFDEGYIDDAWVILGSKLERYVSKILQRTYSDDYKVAFGRFDNADNAILLLKISNTTIVEWAYSGAAWFCANTWSDAPKFGKGFYVGKDLRANNQITANSLTIDKVHHRGHGWKSNIASIIEARAGIGLKDL